MLLGVLVPSPVLAGWVGLAAGVVLGLTECFGRPVWIRRGSKRAAPVRKRYLADCTTPRPPSDPPLT